MFPVKATTICLAQAVAGAFFLSLNTSITEETLLQSQSSDEEWELLRPSRALRTQSLLQRTKVIRQWRQAEFLIIDENVSRYQDCDHINNYFISSQVFGLFIKPSSGLNSIS